MYSGANLRLSSVAAVKPSCLFGVHNNDCPKVRHPGGQTNNALIKLITYWCCIIKDLQNLRPRYGNYVIEI